jgi:hypothetical protein
MRYPEKSSRQDITDQSQGPSRRLGSPKRLQQLRSEFTRFTPSYAQEQRDYADRVSSGEDRGKRRYDPYSERSVDEYGKTNERVNIEQKGLLGGVGPVVPENALDKIMFVDEDKIDDALNDSSVSGYFKGHLSNIRAYISGEVDLPTAAINSFVHLGNNYDHLSQTEKNYCNSIGISNEERGASNG